MNSVNLQIISKNEDDISKLYRVQYVLQRQNCSRRAAGASLATGAVVFKCRSRKLRPREDPITSLRRSLCRKGVSTGERVVLHCVVLTIRCDYLLVSRFIQSYPSNENSTLAPTYDTYNILYDLLTWLVINMYDACTHKYPIICVIVHYERQKAIT